MSELIIGFSRPNRWKPFAKIIQAVESTPYSHVYVKWYSPSSDRWIIYQASGSAINFEGTKHFLLHAIPIEEYSLEISDESKRKLIQYAIDNCGVAYGIKQVLGIGIVKLAAIFGIKIKNPFSDGADTQVCAELLGRILEDVLGDNLNLDLDLAGPKALNEVVQNIPNIKRVI